MLKEERQYLILEKLQRNRQVTVAGLSAALGVSEVTIRRDLREMDAQVERLYAFANNHWEGQAVSTARQLRMFLERQDSAS